MSNLQVVFGGVDPECGMHPKGRVLEQLIQNGHLKVNPRDVLFVDDTSESISDMQAVFKNLKRPENMYTFQYSRYKRIPCNMQ